MVSNRYDAFAPSNLSVKVYHGMLTVWRTERKLHTRVRCMHRDKYPRPKPGNDVASLYSLCFYHSFLVSMQFKNWFIYLLLASTVNSFLICAWN